MMNSEMRGSSYCAGACEKEKESAGWKYWKVKQIQKWSFTAWFDPLSTLPCHQELQNPYVLRHLQN